MINWAVAFGTAFAAIPFNEMYVRFGAKWPFFAAGVLSSLATVLMPLAAEFDLYALLAFRFLQVCNSQRLHSFLGRFFCGRLRSGWRFVLQLGPLEAKRIISGCPYRI